ncbi:hypothetical protein [Pelagicoccus sp. SDUM812003]|uniref:hypothetical protein n=1 Tax=Pelagicoccus sp. SDUM812003 TaxID=3041267 RepID=UPI0028118761|nr:hypothetical protein [Pelagicoccus sp. SDUM812003]
MMSYDSENGSAFLQIITISLVTQALLGLLLCFSASKISNLLFKENSTIIFEGRIDAQALLSVGIGLIGVYILVSNLPGFLESGFRWVKTTASSTSVDDQFSVHGPFALHSTIMVVAGLVLAAKRSAISRMMGTNKRRENQSSHTTPASAPR